MMFGQMYCALAYLTKLLIISVISWYGMISYPISVTDSLILPILKDSAVFCANFIPKSSSPYIAITSKTAERWTFKSCEIVNCLQKQKLASCWRNCKSLFNDDVVSHLSFSRHQMIADHELIIEYIVIHGFLSSSSSSPINILSSLCPLSYNSNLPSSWSSNVSWWWDSNDIFISTLIVVLSNISWWSKYPDHWFIRITFKISTTSIFSWWS